jgi:hypothetical protein
MRYILHIIAPNLPSIEILHHQYLKDMDPKYALIFEVPHILIVNIEASQQDLTYLKLILKADIHPESFTVNNFYSNYDDFVEFNPFI